MVWKLGYAAGALAVFGTSPWSGASDGHPIGVYFDPVNGLVHFRYLMDWCCGGQELQAFNATTLAFAYGTRPALLASDADADGSFGLAGDGGATFFYGGAHGTTIRIVRVTASATGYGERFEVGIPELAAAGTAGAMVYDGSELLYVVNENGQKLRLLRRHGQDAYRLYDLVAASLDPAAQPAIWRRSGSTDLAVLYRDNTAQATGEIKAVFRASGVWRAPVTVAGGTATGFGNVSASPDDANDVGTVHLLYRTGTAAAYGVVEDQIAFPAPAATTQVSGTVSSATASGVLGTVPVSAYANDGAGCCRLVATALTDAAGGYQLTVPAGTYRIQFQPPTGLNDYAARWYGPGLPQSFAEASNVVVTGGQTGVSVALSSALAVSPAAADPVDKDASAHLFTMSDGARLAIYRSRNASYFRLKAHGTWGAPIDMGEWFRTRSGWTRNGDTLFGIAASTVNDRLYIVKLAYADGQVTQSWQNIWCCDTPGYIGGVYYDAVNALVHIRYFMPFCCGGQRMEAYDAATLSVRYRIGTLAYSPSGADMHATMGVAGDGGATFFYGGVSGMAFTIVRVTASATGYTETIETGTPPLAAPATGGSMIWDGTRVQYVANEGDARLRLTERTAQDSYTSWTDLLTAQLGPGAQPALSRRLATNDLALFVQSTAGQPAGEIRFLRRTAGVWSAAPSTLAGGAPTGWGNVSAAADDGNSPDRYRVLYRVGAPGSSVLVEDFANGVDRPANTAPVVTVPANTQIFMHDGLNVAGSFADPDPGQSWTGSVDFGDGTGPMALALNPDHTFALVHAYRGVGTYTVTVAITDSAGAVGSASFHVKVVPKRVMVYVHGTTGSFRQDASDPARNDMPSLFGQLFARYGPVQFFRFYEDRGNQDPAASPRCLATGRRAYPIIDPSAGMPLDSAGADPAPGICDSNDDIELNGVLLDDDVRALAARFDKVTLLSNSGGTRIVRSFLAYAAARAAANPTQFSSLALVDQVVTLEGVQQGTYIAAAYNGLDTAARLDPRAAFARAVVGAIVTAWVGHDPNRPTFEDVTPGSKNIVYSNKSVPIPNGIHYVNVYGNIRVKVLQSFGFFRLPTDTVEIGDVVMLPGDDDPTAVPDTGGARFLPAAAGRGQSSTEWDLVHDFDLDFDPSADRNTFGSVLAAPELHTNFGKKMHDICVRGGDATIQHLDDALFRAIIALDDGTAPDPTKLGFGIAPRVACVASLGVVSAAPVRAFAAAAAPRPELVFQDQRSRAVFTVQADASAPDAGHFTLAIPGRGVYGGIAARRARETEGKRLHLNFKGQAQLRSGTPARLQTVPIHLEAELDTARHSGEVELHDGDYEFHLNARPASTAGLGPTIAAVESSLTANDPTRFYSLLSTTVTRTYSAPAFAAAWNDGATTGRITALTRGTVGSVQTSDQGFSYVAVPYTATLTTPSGATSSLAFRMILIYEGHAWKFMTTIRQ